MSEQTTKAKPSRDAASNALDAKLLLKTLTALKNGDFSVRLPSDWAGMNGKIADTLNDVIEINDRLTKEMERVSRVVGRDGKITQRATPPVAHGSWVSLVESVNTLIDDLLWPTREVTSERSPGSCGSSFSRVDTRIRATIRLRYQLRSEGTTYQGALSVLVRSLASP